jgi:formylglycine-generating enzyme
LQGNYFLESYEKSEHDLWDRRQFSARKLKIEKIYLHNPLRGFKLLTMRFSLLNAKKLEDRMKKLIVLFIATALTGMIFWSCSDGENTTEPTNKAPTCSIASPSDNATFAIGSQITVSVAADDSDGNIFEVRFYIDDVQKESDQNSPYSFILNTDTLNAGTHTIKAVAEDTDGAEASSKINIILNPGEMVFVHGGTFEMGDRLGDGSSYELPLHSVTVSDFFMGANEVTQEEWSQYMPPKVWNPMGTGDTYPAYYSSWYEVIKYCNLRSMNEGLTPCYMINGSEYPEAWGPVPTSTDTIWNAAICNWNANGYRLPTEAEWEYAARGGIHNLDNFRYSGCNLETDLTNYAWYFFNTVSYTHPVGTKLPNQLGLYDMSGNAWEWCWDWYSNSYYSTSPGKNPRGPDTGTSRIRRGGYWSGMSSDCRVSYRGSFPPDYDFGYIGFRLVRKP